MKKVPCSNPTCNQRRRHHETPDENRETVMCDVPDGHVGVAFCSITCACYAGYYNVRHGWVKNPRDGTPIEPSPPVATLKNQYTPKLVSNPGATLADMLEERGLPTAEFADIAQMSVENVQAIIDGTACITPEIAAALEQALGTPASFWMARESRYRNSLKQKEGMAELSQMTQEFGGYDQELGGSATTTLSAENARRFLEIIEETEPNEALKKVAKKAKDRENE